MNDRAEYNQALDRIAIIFQELHEIVLAIKDDFVNEHSNDPNLSMRVVDFYLAIAEKYFVLYQGKSKRSTGWSLAKDLMSTRQNLRSFNREFEDPFFKSRRWGQRINQLSEELSKEATRIDELINRVENGEN
jgi:hypothetical protein